MSRFVVAFVLLFAMAACTPAPDRTKTLPADYADFKQHSVGIGEDHDVAPLRVSSNVRLTSPGAGLWFDQVYITPELDFAQAITFGLAESGIDSISAGAGRELLVAVTGAGESSGETVTDDQGGPSVKVQAGGVDLPVRGLPVRSERGWLLVASIPAGSDPQLVLTDLGKTQTASLRDGRRGGYDARAYYPLRTGKVLMTSPAHVTTQPLRGYAAVLDIRAALVAYDAKRGWAPSGGAWLLLTIDHQGSSNPADTGNWYLEVDLAEHLTVRAKGLPARTVPGRLLVVESQKQTLTTTVAVPDLSAIGDDIEFVMKGAGDFVSGTGKRSAANTEIDTTDGKLRLSVAPRR